MKRLLVSTVLAAFAAAPALLSQNIQIEYGWDSHIVQRVGTTVTPQGQFRVDTNRFDMTIPLLIPGDNNNDLIIRGVGQVFAPRHFWRFYDPYYNGESTTDREQPYIDQFKGVQSWSLDSVRVAVFHNSDNLNPQVPGQLDVYRLNTDYTNNRNSDSGITIDRADLEDKLVDQLVMTEDVLLNTVTEQGAIVPTTLKFDPALEFGKEESALVMYINDFADPIEQPINDGDTREWQRVIGYIEYQDGDGSTGNPFRNPVPHNMVHGMILRSVNGVDIVTNTYRAISFGGGLEYAANFNMIWFGVVELDTNDLPKGSASSVRYHFGYDATEQGLGDVTPNPVRDEAIIPFSLTETSNVTVELYTADGRMVETLVENKQYIAGKYSIKMSAENLESGSYLVRMSANDKAYSMKLVVTK